MTPEREAQMRGLYEQWAKEQGHPYCDVYPAFGPTSSRPETVDRFSEMGWIAFLACARALEPMVRDGERYAFLKGISREELFNKHAIELGWYEPTADLDSKLDKAMSAALEDGNADV